VLPSVSSSSSAIEDRLQPWVAHARLFGRFAQAGLLAPDGVAEVQELLEVDLRRCLNGATTQDLRRIAGQLRDGGTSIGRAALALTKNSAEGIPEIPKTVSNAAFDALRIAETSEGPDAINAARESLMEAQLVDPACFSESATAATATPSSQGSRSDATSVSRKQEGWFNSPTHRSEKRSLVFGQTSSPLGTATDVVLEAGREQLAMLRAEIRWERHRETRGGRGASGVRPGAALTRNKGTAAQWPLCFQKGFPAPAY
jgi:hypothetical protein